MISKRFTLAVAAAAVMIAGCGGGGGAAGGGGQQLNLVQPGTLTVCSDLPYPPFEMEAQGGGYTGFDVDLMREISKGLDLDLSVKRIGFEPIQSGAALSAGQCDVAASAMTILKEREKNLDFSRPYFDADQSLLVKKDSGIKSLDDLANKRIGVQQATTGQDYAEENTPSGAEIVAFPGGTEVFSALNAGQVDASLQDIGLNAFQAQKDNSVEVAATFPTGEKYGFAVAEQGQEELLERINNQLKKLEDDGTYDRIYKKYFKAES